MIRQHISYVHEYTDHEVAEFAREQKAILDEIAALQEEAKAAAKAFKTKIEGKKELLELVGEKIESNGETIQTLALCDFDKENGIKHCYAIDGEGSPAEYLTELPLTEQDLRITELPEEDEDTELPLEDEEDDELEPPDEE